MSGPTRFVRAHVEIEMDDGHTYQCDVVPIDPQVGIEGGLTLKPDLVDLEPEGGWEVKASTGRKFVHVELSGEALNLQRHTTETAPLQERSLPLPLDALSTREFQIEHCGKPMRVTRHHEEWQEAAPSRTERLVTELVHRCGECGAKATIATEVPTAQGSS